MTKPFPARPAHPERICWGCDRYCAVDNLMCGNGSLATPHPSELFGEDWLTWGQDANEPTGVADAAGAVQPQQAPPEQQEPDATATAGA